MSDSEDGKLPGFITPMLQLAAGAMTAFSEWWLRSRIPGDSNSRQRAKSVERVIALCCTVEVLGLVSVSFRDDSAWKLIAIGSSIFVALRMFDIIGWSLRMSMFDRHRPDRNKDVRDEVSSIERAIVLGFVNYIEMILILV